MNSVALLLVLFAGVMATTPAPVLPKFPTLYEISMRPWLYEMGVKRLRDAPLKKFEELRARGVDIVYLLGAWQLGPAGLQHDRTDPGLLSGFAQVLPGYSMDDIIGSPFAVTDYSTNSEVGNDEDLAWFREKLHEMGLALWLDFVPNHSALDANLSSQLDLYVRAPKEDQPPYDQSKYTPQGVAFGNCPNSNVPWTDVAQWNYWNPETKKVMINNLLKVASLSDGIRCDMAYLVINYVFEQTWGKQLASWGWKKPSTEFWPDAISTVKSQYPGTYFMAEVYDNHETELQGQGFDYTYDKALLDVLRTGHLDNTRKYITGKPYDWLVRSAHFVENHDEPRAVDTIGTWQKADMAAAIAHTIPGIRFHWHGQWDGLRNKLDVHLRRSAPEQKVQQVDDFYRHLSQILNATAFREGQWTYATVTSSSDSWRLMAWRWASGSDKRLVVINDSEVRASGAIVLPDVSGSGDVNVDELWSGAHYVRSASEMRSSGLWAVVDPWSVQIFQYP